ncbi:hypothetical protein PUN28_011039 [Cardiocondyla obscurior]|uniref:Uncharacterized protein n=1 Tax=Cardiocondyla obscurior TaxID=286306 RepID=A0AAW2FIV9_9HYME
MHLMSIVKFIIRSVAFSMHIPYFDEKFCALEWIIYLKRHSLIALMLCGVVLYYHILINVIANELKFILNKNGIKHAEIRSRIRNYCYLCDIRTTITIKSPLHYFAKRFVFYFLSLSYKKIFFRAYVTDERKYFSAKSFTFTYVKYCLTLAQRIYSQTMPRTCVHEITWKFRNKPHYRTHRARYS